jgi:serine/threonine protein kinase
MLQFGGKNAKKTSSDTKRNFTVVMGNKEHGLYVSSTPSSAAKKAVTKLCAANKSKKVQFHIREITQGSKKKTYGPYIGHIEKLKEPIELKGRIIKYKPIAKLSRKTSKKKGKMMKGGGYTSTLSINKGDINDIIHSTNYNSNESLVFTVTEVKESGNAGETINYTNIKYLGKGTYGKVFLVTNDKGEKFVIKITNRYIEYFLKEPKILDGFMTDVNEKCRYKAVSQGETDINGKKIGHIIFPYKGDYEFYQIVLDTITNDSKISLIPKILRDVLICLIDINKYACHGDIKLDNIVYNKETDTGFIIDFGLTTIFPITIDSLYTMNLGNRQFSVDIIIGYLLRYIRTDKNISILDDLYLTYLKIIGESIDNFGLFWIIVESISNPGIFYEYITDDNFLVIYKKRDLFNTYLNFYFNLDIKPKTPLRLELEKLFNYKPVPNFRQEFIENIFKQMKPIKFIEYFKSDKNLFYTFMKNVLELIAVDPTERIQKQDLLKDPFFEIRE